MKHFDQIFSRIAGLKIVPVIAIESTDSALRLADALLEGGLPLVEITFRTAAAAESIKVLTAKRPEILVGAGTILTVEQLRTAIDCGAKFGLAPGLNPAVAREAISLKFPFIPGVMTPTEIEAALTLGLTTLKFFPAGAAGGLPMLNAITAPYASQNISFIPTGGVDEKNLAAYLALKSVCAVGGTWLAKKEDISGAKWGVIRDRCRHACEIVKSISK
jgi:2-dehydro-3-deoxyphosphogluconate aldolase / (4S)-4-hydroxy-2-oxoglutarate aldolase